MLDPIVDVYYKYLNDDDDDDDENSHATIEKVEEADKNEKDELWLC